MSAFRVLIALVVGIAIGALAASYGGTTAREVIDGVGVIGTMWISAIRMTVIPLVGALTVVSVATIGDPKRVGRLGGIAIAVFTVVLVVSGVFAMLVTPLAFQFAPDAPAALRDAYASRGPTSPVAMPSLVQRIIEIVPVNPVKAAADGALLPLVVFALALGLALTQIAAEKRDAVVTILRTIADAMLVLVGWVLWFAPAGVFALALGLGVRAGADSAAALVHYMATMCVVLFAYAIALYPVAILIGRVSPKAFAMGALPAQAVAFSTRSSLAALPAMIAGARDKMHLPASSTGFVLPLAVSIFRLNVPIAWIVGVIFLGRLYGIDVTQGQLAMLIVTSTLLSFSVPGIPSASLLLISPVLAQYGFPAESVAILIALDAIPDLFKTTLNVTGHLTSAAVVARFETQNAPGVG
jgi:Na+/H+-dicarboxylate symporter